MKQGLIVEDSRLARKELTHLLEEIAYFTQLFTAQDATEAKAILEQESIDVLFLDIHLPGHNGFELLEELVEVPQVIFTTAYDQYAIKSFDYNTVDYLLKPIKKDRLLKALDKLNSSPSTPTTTNLRKQIFIKDGDRCWFVPVKDIRLIESIGNYSRIHFQDQRPLLHRSLNYLENALDPTIFFRVNRQQIINLDYIQQVDNSLNGKLKLSLTSGESIEVSRRQSNRIKQLFSL